MRPARGVVLLALALAAGSAHGQATGGALGAARGFSRAGRAVSAAGSGARALRSSSGLRLALDGMRLAAGRSSATRALFFRAEEGEEPELHPAKVAAFLALLFVVAVVWFNRGARVPAAPPPPCELRRLTVGFDWGARARLQSELRDLANTASLQSEQGLADAAKKAASLLEGALGSARYAAWQSLRVEPEQAEPLFAQMVRELKGRFEHLVQNGMHSVAAPAVRARAEEGEGLVVVTLVVGVQEPLRVLPETLDRNALGWALRNSVPALSSALRAFEVVWSPALEEDRLSSAELEALYPELLRLEGGSPLGRVVCAHCHGVYARERQQCPACGSAESKSVGSPTGAAPATGTRTCAFCKQATPAYEVQCQACGARATT